MAPTFEYLPLMFGTEIECYTMVNQGMIDNFYDHLEHLAMDFKARGLVLRPDSCPNKVDYTKFSVTYDGSLGTGFSTVEKAELLNISVDEACGWTQCGTELVSPPLPTPRIDTSVHELDQAAHQPRLREYIKALKQGACHKSFVNDNCGLHLHFGLENGSHIPLPVLQYLALILIKYEDVISSLHGPSRTPYVGRKAAEYCKSNRISFLVDGHTCHRHQEQMFNLDMAKQQIFNPDMTVNYLAWLMSSDHIVDDEDGRAIPTLDGGFLNFGAPEWERRMSDRKQRASSLRTNTSAAATNESRHSNTQSASSTKEDNIGHLQKYKISRWNLLARDDDGPRTIEFRQPAGTLDTEEIEKTIQFYTAIIRAAERHAAGLQVMKDAESANLNNLLDLLQLADPVCQYWHLRANQMVEQRRVAGLEEDKLSAKQKCVLCLNSDDGTYDSRKRREEGIILREKELIARAEKYEKENEESSILSCENQVWGGPVIQSCEETVGSWDDGYTPEQPGVKW